MKNKTFIIFLFLSFNAIGQIDTIEYLKKSDKDFYNNVIYDTLYLDSIYYESTSSNGILIGLNYWKNPFFEFGYGFANYGVMWNHWSFNNLYIGSEVGIANKQIVLGPKISVWANGGSSAGALGLNLIEYTDFNESTLVFRPEIGMGMGKFKLVYGYNVKFYNKNFKYISKNNLNLIFYIDTKIKDNYKQTYREYYNSDKTDKLEKLRNNLYDTTVIGKYRISGTVKSKNTNNFIDSVEVEIKKRGKNSYEINDVIYSNENGEFTFYNLPKGQYTLYFRHKDYILYNENIELNENSIFNNYFLEHQIIENKAP